MRRVLTVARSEFLMLVRSKAFIIGVVLMPVLLGTFMLFVNYAEHHVDVADRTFAVVGEDDVHDHPDRRGLAGAVGADEAVDRSLGHVERDVADGGDGTEAFRDAADGDGGAV